jgi:hypothetical protein
VDYSLTHLSLETVRALREEYRPDPIRVLLVGESPPASGKFFYAANSRLYAATLEAFSRFVPGLQPKDFLKEFKRMGFYLMDLCNEPVNHLRDPDRLEKRVQGIRLLADWLKSIPADQPQAVISVMKDIRPYVQEALDLSGRKQIELDSVPFPFDDETGVEAYVNALGRVLLRLKGKGLLG